MEQFPIILKRTGGLKIKTFTSLFHSPYFESKILFFYELEKDVQSLKEKLLSILYFEIRDNIKENSKLINLKRDIYNNKKLKKYYNVNFNLSEGCQDHLTKYFALMKEYETHLDLFVADYEIILKNSIKNINKIAKSDFFLNGLLFSSTILYKEIIKTNFNFRNFNKKDKRITISVLKYLSRAATKTTPFSTFTRISILEIDNHGNYNCNINKVVSSYKVNNLFYHHLKEALFNISHFKRKMMVQVNDTLRIESTTNKYSFFSNEANESVFKKLPGSDFLEFLLNRLSENKITYEDLILLTSRVSSSSHEKSINFIDRLITEGFLSLSYPVGFYQPDWISELKSFLQENFTDQIFLPAIELLSNLEKSESQLQLSNVFQKNLLIKNSYADIVSVLEYLKPDTRFKEIVAPQNLFFENHYSFTSERLTATVINKISCDLKEVYFKFFELSFKKAFKSKLCEALSEHGGKLSLIDFFEKIYLKELGDFSLDGNTFDEMKNIKLSINEFLNEKADLDFIDLKLIFKDKTTKEYDSISFGAYLQPIKDDFSSYVINGFSTGYGSNCSRFLIDFTGENKYHEKVKQYNKSRKSIISDVKDASIHNANVYPPITNHVITSSNDKNLENSYKLLKISEIDVCGNKNHGIYLTVKGKKITPVNLTMEGLNRRSKFSQFLDLFSPNEVFGFETVLHNIESVFKRFGEDKYRRSTED